MRRKDREITDLSKVIEVIGSCRVCRIAMCDGDRPYIVPLNFGYTIENGVLTLYFHSASEGRKLDILKKAPNLCFEMDSEKGLVEADNPCSFGYAFASVIGEGRVEFIEGHEAKSRALNRIMLHQAGREYTFPQPMTEKVCVYSVTASEFACKIRAK